MSALDPIDDVKAKRAVLDAAIAVALPVAGGVVRKRLKQLRKALAETDAQNKPCAECGHTIRWHKASGCLGDIRNCGCHGFDPGPDAAGRPSRLTPGETTP